MIILYGSYVRAAQPLEIVRARTPGAPSGDYASYVRKTTCDEANHFSFKGLPDGAWFVITLARPAGGGDPVAVMRRVETHGAVATLNLGCRPRSADRASRRRRWRADVPGLSPVGTRLIPRNIAKHGISGLTGGEKIA